MARGGTRRDTATALLVGMLLALLTPANGGVSVASGAEEGAPTWLRRHVSLHREGLHLRVFGQRWPVPDRRIVDGEIADDEVHRFQVALLDASIEDDFDAMYCGGTLIGENVVVTAAHCSTEVTPEGVAVLSGTRRLDGTGTRHRVARIVVHPEWNVATGEKDVAVWTLASDVDDVEPAELSEEDASVGEILVATGWGADAEGEYPRALRSVDVRLAGARRLQRCECVRWCRQRRHALRPCRGRDRRWSRYPSRAQHLQGRFGRTVDRRGEQHGSQGHRELGRLRWGSVVRGLRSSVSPRHSCLYRRECESGARLRRRCERMGERWRVRRSAVRGEANGGHSVAGRPQTRCYGLSHTIRTGRDMASRRWFVRRVGRLPGGDCDCVMLWTYCVREAGWGWQPRML